MRGGEGETQLETDRRRVQERIFRIEEELELVRRQRGTQRIGRKRNYWPLASLVGYTNAGKSTLLNALTGASTLSANQLFATLDPTTRRLRLPTNQNVLLTDTVGFIRKLPHGLVEAFKATLEEVVEADLLLHIVDLSHAQAEDQIEAVNSVLQELHAADKPTLMVFNKIDRVENPAALDPLLARYSNAVAVSAVTGQGIPELLAELGAFLRPVRELVKLAVPHEHAAVIARLYSLTQVVESDFEGPRAKFQARIPPHLLREFKDYITDGPNGHAGNGHPNGHRRS
jgi:GTP-binding protein HflX